LCGRRAAQDEDYKLVTIASACCRGRARIIASETTFEENHMQTTVASLALALGLATAALPAAAQTGHAGHMMPVGATQAAPAAMTNGLVKKVDKAAGRVTIAHEEIRNLGMPPMTMVFRVKDPAWIGRMKDGDRIRFAAEDANGTLVVVAYEPVK
jgi:Cu(I)/Ag(I) efflux system periplasmic protein CusF